MKLTPGCADTPGKWKKTVRLFVKTDPAPAGAVVTIAGFVARYDKHWGHYIDVLVRPKDHLKVSVIWLERDPAKTVRVKTELVKFDCSGCSNGKGK